MPVLWVDMNCRLGRVKFKSLLVLLDSGNISYTILGKHTQKLHKKTTKSVRWSTHAADFHTNLKIKVDIVPPKLYTTNIITWIFNVDDSQGNHNYNMILGYDILSKLK